MAEDYINYNNDNGEMFKPVDAEKPNYIKVVGVGGGGGNAVNHMMEEGIQGVDFVLCNTDHQALLKSKVKTTVHLGKRELGAGNDPNIGREAAEMSRDELESLMDDKPFQTTPNLKQKKSVPHRDTPYSKHIGIGED